MSNAILSAQTRLNELGYHTGPLDGILGTTTRAAIMAFQRATQLVPDGILGQRTEAALFGISPTPAAPPIVSGALPTWPRQSGVEAFFGNVGANQTSLTPPYAMKLAWDKSQPVSHFSIHEECHDSALRCLQRIASAYDEAKRADLGIDLFGGCLNVRRMTGGTNWSMHAWGIAIDFDPDRNQYGWGRDRARLAKPDAEAFWKIWEDEGWVSLGRSCNKDFMHVQAARL